MVDSKIGQAIQQAVITALQNAIITSAGDPTRDINRVIDVVDTGAFDAIDNALNDAIQRTAKEEKFTESKQLTETQKKIDAIQKDMSDIQRKIANPESFIQGELTGMLERIPAARMALRLIPIISAALAAPEIINKIITILLSPGGPFDRRLKIIIENNVEQFLSRENQKRRQLGLDPVIITGFEGFGNAQGRLTTNTLKQKKDTGTTEIGLNEIAIGFRE